MPRDFKVLGISVNLGALAGSPTTLTCDIQDDGTDIITATALADAYTAITPVNVASGSLIEVDINLAGGSTPTFTGTIALVGLWGA